MSWLSWDSGGGITELWSDIQTYFAPIVPKSEIPPQPPLDLPIVSTPKVEEPVLPNIFEVLDLPPISLQAPIVEALGVEAEMAISPYALASTVIQEQIPLLEAVQKFEAAVNIEAAAIVEQRLEIIEKYPEAPIVWQDIRETIGLPTTEVLQAIIPLETPVFLELEQRQEAVKGALLQTAVIGGAVAAGAAVAFGLPQLLQLLGLLGFIKPKKKAKKRRKKAKAKRRKYY